MNRILFYSCVFYAVLVFYVRSSPHWKRLEHFLEDQELHDHLRRNRILQEELLRRCESAAQCRQIVEEFQNHLNQHPRLHEDRHYDFNEENEDEIEQYPSYRPIFKWG